MFPDKGLHKARERRGEARWTLVGPMWNVSLAQWTIGSSWRISGEEDPMIRAETWIEMCLICYRENQNGSIIPQPFWDVTQGTHFHLICCQCSLLQLGLRVTLLKPMQHPQPGPELIHPRESDSLHHKHAPHSNLCHWLCAIPFSLRMFSAWWQASFSNETENRRWQSPKQCSIAWRLLASCQTATLMWALSSEMWIPALAELGDSNSKRVPKRLPFPKSTWITVFLSH